jgi:hypothetical protein
MATQHKKGAIEKVVGSAVDAAEELGAAATSLKESWEHVQKARAKARPATAAATSAGKRMVKATKRTAHKAVKAVKKASK